MKKIACIFVFLLCTPLAAQAQNNQVEVFAGYSYVRADGMPSNASLQGWDGSVTYKVSSYLGITGDVSGNYGTLTGSAMNLHSYLFGPQVCLPRRFSPFVHALFGASRSSVFGGTRTAFSVAIGGGLDLRATDHLSLRLIQADVITGNLKSTSSDGRIATGIVFRF